MHLGFNIDIWDSQNFKQNFKPILGRPYSDVAKKLDSLSWPILHSLSNLLHADMGEI